MQHRRRNASSTKRSVSIDSEVPVKVPFLGYKILDNQSLNIRDISKFIDKNALFAGQWQIKKLKYQ